MSVVIDNSNGSFLSEVDSLRELIDVDEMRELNEWRYLFVVHKFGFLQIALSRQFFVYLIHILHKGAYHANAANIMRCRTKKSGRQKL